MAYLLGNHSACRGSLVWWAVLGLLEFQPIRLLT